MIRDNDTENGYSIKATISLLEMHELSVADAWRIAEENTLADTKIVSLAKMLAEKNGIEFLEEELMAPLYVVTSKKGYKGASAIMNKKELAKIGAKHQANKLVALPSSIHEMIIFPYEENCNIEVFNDMVKDVNAVEVAPEEVLADRAFLIEL